MLSRLRIAAAALALSLIAIPSATADVPPQAPQPAQADGVTALLRNLETVLQGGDPSAFLTYVTDSADASRAREFAQTEIIPSVTRAVIQERVRDPLQGTLPGEGYELVVDVFAERAARARVATWRLDVKRVSQASSPSDIDEWRIADEQRMSSFDGLYKISLDPAREYDARGLKIVAEDLQLTLDQGSIFVATTDAGVAGVVVTGRGNMRFSPPSVTEKGQVRIFSGSDVLETAFDAAFIRLNPTDFDALFPASQMASRAVDPKEFRRADEIFKTESVKSYSLDLADLSRDAWSLVPASGDVLAEIRTRRFDTLTYAREAFEAEDITLFDRKKQRNIALYPSRERLAKAGAFYNDDDLAEYDVQDYDIDLSISPERSFIEGRARVRLKVHAQALGALTMRLADQLAVQSVVSDQFGRLFALRVKDQNMIVVNLPEPVAKDTVLEVTVAYSGRLPPQEPDRETAMPGPQLMPSQVPLEQGDLTIVPAEPNYLYSNSIYWYPQGSHSDFATASMRVTVPSKYAVVASGELSPQSPTDLPGGTEPRHLYAFNANEPQRYLAVLVSRFERADEETVEFDSPNAPPGDMPPLEGGSYNSMDLIVETNPRQVQVGRNLTERAADIAKFYASVIGDSPYPSFTIALVESDLPGGHSPAYFAQLNTPIPMMRFAWRNDPVVFAAFPDFFLAHELAHQWWGQAVGWGNYHEQWISEGFAQYFAAMYAQHEYGDETFGDVLQQLRKWSLDDSDQGPVYLGYRLGHIKGDQRVFRSLVYNKGAAVLHMLRRLVGDEAFFNGVRRFYRASRFKKVGTEDFRKAMETESHQSLERFFQRWIYGATLPNVKFSYKVDGGDAVLHFDQVGEVFDLPVTVTLTYTDNTRVDVPVMLRDASVDQRVPLTGTLKTAVVSQDDGALVEISK